MGLLLFCGNMSIKMGSYSSVHIQRVGLIKAYILYLKETIPSSSNAMDNALQAVANRRLASKLGTILVQGGYCPSLDTTRLRALKADMHGGIFSFVYHSDCDGSWNPAAAASIQRALHLLRPYLKRVEELRGYLDKKSGEFYWEEILHQSTRYMIPIFFA